MAVHINDETYAKVTGKPPEKPKRRSKYRAKPTEYDGRRYDSIAEAKRAMELDLLKQHGAVRWWLPQVPVPIGEPGVDKPYRVDFLVCHVGVDGSESICAEDVKGVDTASFRRHVRQWRKRGPFPLHVIRMGKVDEVIPRGSEA
jgi:hypothetical protein